MSWKPPQKAVPGAAAVAMPKAGVPRFGKKKVTVADLMRQK